MINLLCGIRRQDHPIRLNLEFRRDLVVTILWRVEWRELFSHAIVQLLARFPRIL